MPHSFSYTGPSAAPGSPGGGTSTLQFSSQLLAEGTDYGFDVLVFPDLDASFSLVNDSRVLGEALARRLLTPRGRLDFHPNYGLDIRDFLNDAVTQDSLFRLQAAAEAECEQDERVLDASVRATYDPDAEKLTLTISIDASSGPFKFVLAVTDLTAELLASQD
jgi:phage baseplate assembly protein W